MAAAGELLPPVGYSGSLLVAAVVLPLVVGAYYAAVTWLTRRPRRPEPRSDSLADARRDALARLEEIEQQTAVGAMPLRAGHRAISEAVRVYVARVDDVDARVLTLEQLRQRYADSGPVDVVALVYPPQFAPGDQGRPSERLAPALEDARALVTRWRP